MLLSRYMLLGFTFVEYQCSIICRESNMVDYSEKEVTDVIMELIDRTLGPLLEEYPIPEKIENRLAVVIAAVIRSHLIPSRSEDS